MKNIFRTLWNTLVGLLILLLIFIILVIGTWIYDNYPIWMLVMTLLIVSGFIGNAIRHEEKRE